MNLTVERACAQGDDTGGVSLFLGSLHGLQHCYVKLQLIFLGAGTLNKASSWEKRRFSLTSLHQTSV